MRPIVCLLGACLLLATGCDRQKPDAPQPAGSVQSVRGVDRGHRGEPAPSASFADPDGGEASLAAFAGRPVLVNLWASWCAPCVKELPTLDRLAARHGRDGRLAVIAVSQDMGPQSSVEAFLDRLKLTDLDAAFHDPDMALTAALGVTTMPTTVLYGADGREVWRYVGDLDWSGAEAAKLLAEAE